MSDFILSPPPIYTKQIESPSLALLNKLNVVDEYSDNRRLLALFQERIPRELAPYAGTFAHGAINELLGEKKISREQILHAENIQLFGHALTVQTEAIWQPNYDYATVDSNHKLKAGKIVSGRKSLRDLVEELNWLGNFPFLFQLDS